MAALLITYFSGFNKTNTLEGDTQETSETGGGCVGTTAENDTQKNQQYNIEQAISDNTRLNTIAFDAPVFSTGNSCADSFLPSGKVADFFGFQYLRDNTPDGMGHSTDFVTQ